MGHAADFAAVVLDPEAAIPAGLSDGQGRSATARFNVYRNNVAVSLADAHEAAFPVVAQLVGAEFFRAMAGVALRQSPPQNQIMAHYGADFPSFLETFPPVTHLPYLADMARIENAVRHAYHAADVAAFDTSAMEQLSPEDLMACTFTRAPAVTILRSAFPVGTLWRNHQPGAVSAKPTQAEDVVISRPGFDPMVHVLPAGGAEVLAACDGHTSFEAALNAATDPDIPALLGLILTQGLVCLTSPRPKGDTP